MHSIFWRTIFWSNVYASKDGTPSYILVQAVDLPKKTTSFSFTDLFKLVDIGY